MASGFRGLFPYEGFDDANGPQQCVPAKGIRFVAYRNVLANPVFESANPHCVAVRDVTPTGSIGPDTRILELTGGVTGTTKIHVSSSGCIRETLWAYCLPRRKMTLACHLVSDGGGHSTARTAASLATLSDEINRVYLPQANVEFVGLPVTNIQVKRDLGNTVTFATQGQPADICQGASGPGGEMLDSLIPGAGPGDVHLYFVWEMDGYSDTPGALDGYTAPTTRHCMIRDNTGAFPLWFVAAHEIGHALGMAHTSRMRSWLNTIHCPVMPKGDPCEGGHAPSCKHWAELSRHLMMHGNNTNSPFIAPQAAMEINARLMGH